MVIHHITPGFRKEYIHVRTRWFHYLKMSVDGIDDEALAIVDDLISRIVTTE